MAHDPRYELPTYTPPARLLHWTVALLIAVQFPLGFYMVYRGNEMPGVDEKGAPVTGVWDEVTGFLYNSHKLLGVTILLIVLLRLGYRLMHGAPRPDPTLNRAMLGSSHLVHWSLYALLIVVPILGYVASSYGRYLDVFGIPFPTVTEKNEDMSKEVFGWHEAGAMLVLALVVIHIAAAIYHRFVRRDRVVERMLPKRIV
ncbi:cytochrome b [Hyphomicrobium methylovorum]|uniref:cytochrome b n=1 Tax=Hyphomicrobium methylovorum TaxID=84 RepID=UPI0015E7E007|nr:cytochrome b [Hyphomicrobium methylovorum]MBA2127653.1 cytochrome b [Hyphomicrobium methylovorum]